MDHWVDVLLGMSVADDRQKIGVVHPPTKWRSTIQVWIDILLHKQIQRVHYLKNDECDDMPRHFFLC